MFSFFAGYSRQCPFKWRKFFFFFKEPLLHWRGKKILQSCEVNLSLHSHIWFYFYSCTSNLKEKALKVNSRFLKRLTVHAPVLFSTSQKIQPIFISAVHQCLSFVLQQHCMFLKTDLDEFHPSFTTTRERQMALKTKSTTEVELIYKNSNSFFLLSSIFTSLQW